MSRHKYFDVIVAWASGEPIQLRCHFGSEWYDLDDYDGSPNFDHPYTEWRVKPKQVVVLKLTKVTKSFYNGKNEFCSPHFKFEGVTGSLQLSERPIESYTKEEKNEIYLSIGKSFVEQLQQLMEKSNER